MTTGTPRKKLGEMLVEAGLLRRETLEGLLAVQKFSNRRLGELLVEKGLVRNKDIAAALATQKGMQCIDLPSFPIDPQAVALLPESLARKLALIPLYVEAKDLYVAVADPSNYSALEDVRFVTGMNVRPFAAMASEVAWAIEKYYTQGISIDAIVHDMSQAKSLEVLEIEQDVRSDENDIKQQVEAAPIVKIVNLIITKAAEEKASDIHLEPAKHELLVRNRVDGALRVSLNLPRWTQGPVISRIKIMASMDITERRFPQDGKINVKVGDRFLDLRVSTLPTKHGEKIVIRILDTRNVLLPVEDLALGETNLRHFEDLINRPQGIVLVTGPTGSGKTTTLYTALSRIRNVEKNIVTIEEPIEYELEGINQVGVNPKAGTDFALFLRSVLRQDPDVIMVGEIRDVETAMIAMQASLTGHLVLSTLHTNSAAAAITRLRNLGIPSYLIASTVTGVIAQRLVRVICASCKTADAPDPILLARLGIRPKDLIGTKLYKGKGCSECGNTGFKGRTAVYEMLVVNPVIRNLVTSETPEPEIEAMAIASGMQTLALAARDKVLQGISSVQEVLRVVQTDEAPPAAPLRKVAANMGLWDAASGVEDAQDPGR